MHRQNSIEDMNNRITRSRFVSVPLPDIFIASSSTEGTRENDCGHVDTTIRLNVDKSEREEDSDTALRLIDFMRTRRLDLVVASIWQGGHSSLRS